MVEQVVCSVCPESGPVCLPVLIAHNLVLKSPSNNKGSICQLHGLDVVQIVIPQQRHNNFFE